LALCFAVFLRELCELCVKGFCVRASTNSFFAALREMKIISRKARKGRNAEKEAGDLWPSSGVPVSGGMQLKPL
jgi:hypothetical protein